MDWMGSAGENKAGVGDGTPDVVRLGKTGEVIVGQPHGRYYESGSRNVTYVATTAVAGVAPGTAFSTTPPMALWNPPGSNALIAINKIEMGYISGTLGAGQILIGQAAQTSVPATGTELTPVCNLLGNFQRSGIRAFQGSTLSNTPTIVRPTGIVLGAFVGGAGTVMPPLLDDCGGEFVIAPGNCFVLQGQAGAGTSPLVTFCVTYEVCPLT